MATRYFLILTVLKIWSLSCAEMITLCVTSNTSCTINCEQHSNQTVKLTALPIVLNEQSDMEIEAVLCSAVYTGDEIPILHFTNLVSVAITGIVGTELNCQHREFSGLLFENVSKISLNNLTLNECGFEVNDELLYYGSMYAGVYIAHSANISINSVLIQNSHGVGLVLLNNSGYINISDSSFVNNCAMAESGGGLFIEVAACQQSAYHIQDCDFSNNYCASDGFMSEGGGMNIYFKNQRADTILTVIQCNFTNNTAELGGALQIVFFSHWPSVKIQVNFSKCLFKSNLANVTGGAVAIWVSKRIIIVFSSCDFLNNTATREGGGVYLSTGSTRHQFINSRWQNNSAKEGSAVKIISHNYVKIHFNNCSFENCHCNSKSYYGSTVLVKSAFIYLWNNINFTNNSCTAIALVYSKLVIYSNSNTLFNKNKGYRGGAVNLIDSSIWLNDNTSIAFKSNSAVDKGGAIYQEYNNECFIEYVGNFNVNQPNITVSFSNNLVSRSLTLGSDIFLPSTSPCMDSGDNFTEALNSIANFLINPSGISTAALHLSFDEHIPSPLELFPGIGIVLNISLRDDLNNAVLTKFQVKVESMSNNDYINVSKSDIIVTDNEIKLHGTTNSRGKVSLCVLDQNLCKYLNITLKCCPPGYVYDNQDKSCFCIAENEDEKKKYLGIRKCNHTENKAKLLRGHWAGYIAEQNTCTDSDNHFRTSNCPLGYCNNTANLLPYKQDELNNIVCGQNRYGVICANCSANTSVFYGSYECSEENTLCDTGPVFFILSQLVPLTALFLILIVFDIELTTGALNGFLFYMQTFSALIVTAYGFIHFPTGTDTLLEIFNFLVGAFNLQYFHFSAASFCLHRGATYLDVLAWDYIKVVYALLLIVLTVIIMNLRCYRINKCLQKLNGRNVHYSQSIIHGLSGLLVMCYSRTTIISLKLLAPAWLYKENGVDREQVRVFYYGEMEYFDHKHLKYAIPALFALSLITMLLPMLLLAYPLCYKVLALFRLEESKFATLLCKFIPLEKMRPFFDSFQGAFKDNHRYFAGLYFLYRMLPLLLFVLQSNLADFYMYLEVLLILMLALHIWVQPYKEKRHNYFDSFIFLLLLTINGISFYNYHSQHTPRIYHWAIKPLTSKKNIHFAGTVQVLLAYLPVIVMAVSIVLKKFRLRALARYLKGKLKRQSQPIEDLTLSMIDEGRGIDYQKCA